MAPGTRVELKKEWCQAYRRPGVPLTGVLISQSPSGAISRVRLDDVADSYLRTDHLAIASIPFDDVEPALLRHTAEIQPVPA